MGIRVISLRMALVSEQSPELRRSWRCSRAWTRGPLAAVWLGAAALSCALPAAAQTPEASSAAPSSATAPAPAAAENSAPQNSAPAGAQGNAPQQAAGKISGVVVDSTGAAVGGARVTLARDDGSPARQAVTAEDGSFSFAGVPPGAFHLTIESSGFAAQSSGGTLRSGETFAVPQVTLPLATAVTEVRVAPTQVEIAEDQIKEQEKQRVLGIVPNYYVTYVPNAAPLDTKQKFELAWKTTVDPVTFIITGAVAGIQQANNTFSGYGQGAQGYGKRYGANYADLVVGTYIGGAILPSLLHQDPRYFYKGTGTTKSRFLYAIANAVICKGDNGRWQPNYSNLLGSLAAGGISNAYYPGSDRGAGLTFENFGIGVGATAAANVLQEFVVKRFTPSASNTSNNPQPQKPQGPISKAFGIFVHEGL